MKKSTILFILFFVFVYQAFSQEKELTLHDAVLGRSLGLTPASVDGLRWVDDDHYMYKEDGKVIIKDIITQKEETIALADFQQLYPEMESLPEIIKMKGNQITFSQGNQIIRYNYKDFKEEGKFEYDKNAASRDYFHDKNQMAFTLANNLYIATASNPKIPITNFKDKNIVAGQAIARSEFGIYKGTFWSPTGNLLAFYQKDESNVAEYPLVDMNSYPATLNNIKYPMAGQGSEIAKIGIYNVVTKSTTYLDINTTDEHYLTNLSWSPDEKYVLIAEVNRGQNHFSFNTYDVATGKLVKTLFEESNDRWVEPENDAVFLPKSNTKFLWLSERDGYKNLYLYNMNGELIKQLTYFKFVIKRMLGFDKSGEHVIISTTGVDTRNTQTYRVNLVTGKVNNLTPKKGTHRSQLQGNHLIDNFSNLTTPRIQSVISVENGKENIIFTAPNPLKDYKVGSIELLTLKSVDGFDLHGRIIKPANFDENKKYPVIVYLYGGTHLQLVTNSWQGGARLWMQWMAAQNDYIVFTIDNRGSSNRGFAFESVIHRKAGDAAIEDQLVGIDYLKSLPFVDDSRIAVHGWSYGGFVTTSIMLRHPGVFTTAVAGGPVTDWKYYEVMYGERYMDTPQENPEGYANARVGKYIANLDGKLLLIHGSVDPVVVPQHSMTLLKEAVDKNVQLDFFTYPMHPHNVRGKDRVHLMEKVLNYVLENNK